MDLAPVLLFVYNRPAHTKQTLQALQKNFLASESSLYIFSDGPKSFNSSQKVAEIREIIKNAHGFKNIEIIERENNFGLANSIIEGVSKIIKEYKKVIVIEDDLITSPSFLTYMNKALDFYEPIDPVFSISGYGPPINFDKDYPYDTYLIPTRSGSWGWATWEKVWNKVDWSLTDISRFLSNKKQKKNFDFMGNDMTKMLREQIQGKIDSWSIRFDYHHFKNDAYCVYPSDSFVFNAGMDGTGTHSAPSSHFNVDLVNEEIKDFRFALELDDYVLKQSRKFYNFNVSIQNKVLQKIKHLIKFKFFKNRFKVT